MVITKEQAEKIKEHLLKQLSNFPEDKRAQIKEQVKSMTTEQVENLIEENDLEHLGAKGNCLFCKIAEGEIASFKIAENNDNIAVLEINPLSRGHSLIIPKNHSESLSPETEEFSKAVAFRIKERFNPKEIKVAQRNFTGHEIIEIIPLYGDESERKAETPEELKKIQEEITKEKKDDSEKEEPEEKKDDGADEEIVKLKPRIPR